MTTLPLKQQLAAQLAKAKAEAERELWEIGTLKASRAALERAFNWPKDKPLTKKQRLEGLKKGATKYAGSPGIGKGKEKKWKGRDGYDFVAAILTTQARETCSIAAAICELKKADPKKWHENPRNLARRFSEFRKYWEPWFRLMIEVDARERVLLAKAELEDKS